MPSISDFRRMYIFDTFKCMFILSQITQFLFNFKIDKKNSQCPFPKGFMQTMRILMYIVAMYQLSTRITLNVIIIIIYHESSQQVTLLLLFGKRVAHNFVSLICCKRFVNILNIFPILRISIQVSLPLQFGNLKTPVT